MKKLFVRLMCCFVPSRKLRHKIRKNAFKTEDTLAKLSAQIQSLQQENKGTRNILTQVQKDIQNIIDKMIERTEGIHVDIHNKSWNIPRLIATSELHKQTFAGFRNKFAGKTVVLVGAGPSLNKFKPIKDAIYVGLNRAFLFDKVKFDYLFSIDKAGIDKIYDKFIEYDCVKFVGDQNLGPMFQIPESVMNKIKGLRRYKTDCLFNANFALDIEYMPLGNFNTVSLQAMQFILYTNPAKVYLVGIDCSDAGHFTDNTKNHIEDFDIAKRGENLTDWANYSVVFWKRLKEFADTYYPDTEIISVNPVGLRGLFKDLDQKA